MTRIGDLWRELSNECGRKIKNRSDASFADFADKVLEIAAMEKKFFAALLKEKFINKHH
jgi:hypothetical protein